MVFFRDWNSSSCSAFFKSWASHASYDNIAIRTITSNYRYDFSSLWCLWKSCNDRFNNIHWSPARVLHETRAIDMSYNVALVKDMTPPDPLIQSSHHHPNSQGTLQSWSNVGTWLSKSDEHMTPSDMNIDYKVSSFLHLHNDFIYNSLGSTCTCHYLLVGANISQSASPSKLLCHRHGLVIHNWDPGPSWSTPHEVEEHIKKIFGRPPPCPPP